MESHIAGRYERFARVEAHGQSPLYEMLARHVANSSNALGFLARLPTERQQPNLFFASMRFVAGTPISTDEFDKILAHHGGEIAQVMMERTTQTNEPGRCASLLPALSQIAGPIALIEVGASAGLCLLPDVYGYDWGRQQLPAPVTVGPDAPMFPCQASADTPLPLRHPQIVWRAGLDLNPLDITDDNDVAWLEHLVWPEHRARLSRLRAAISLARHSPPAIAQGDLRKDLPSLIAHAPSEATVVVFHTAVLSYVPSQTDRDDFAAMMLAANVIWLSNEAPSVFPQYVEHSLAPANGMFLLLRDGRPISWTGPHGQAVRWIADAGAQSE